MGIFDKAYETNKRRIENANAPDTFKDFKAVKIKDVTDIIEIKDCFVKVYAKLEKDDKGNFVKDENGKYKTLKISDGDGNEREVLGSVIFVAFGDNQYFASTSRPLINQIRVIDDTIDLKKIGMYHVENVIGNKVKISYIPVPYKDGKEYDNPIFIDVE